MSELVTLTVRLGVGLLTLGLMYPKVGLAFFVGWSWAARVARKLNLSGLWIVLPVLLLVYCWKHRRQTREAIFFGSLAAGAALWTWAIRYSDPSARLRLVFVSSIGAATAAAVWAFAYLGGRAPTPENFRAARAQSLRQWDAERAVAAVTDESVKVDGVRAEGDAVVATVTVAPGQSPADLESHLMDKLAGTVHRLTGRHAVSVTVSRTSTPGRFFVRLDTGHPLRKEFVWRDL